MGARRGVQQDETRALWASGKMMLMVRIARTTHQRIDRLVFLFLSFERGNRERKEGSQPRSPVFLFAWLAGWQMRVCMIQGATVQLVV